MKRSLFLAASVIAGLTVAVAPSARAGECTDGDTKYLAASGRSYTCVNGAFREDDNTHSRGMPCRDGDGMRGTRESGEHAYRGHEGEPGNEAGPGEAGRGGDDENGFAYAWACVDVHFNDGYHDGYYDGYQQPRQHPAPDNSQAGRSH